MLAASGSRMNAAISPWNFVNAASRAPASLYGTIVVSAASSSGTPGLPAMPSVARPEPAATRKESAWPWYAPSALMMRLRPVAPRARRMALIVASVPEFTKRTISIDGTIFATRSARRTSSSVGAPYDVPRREARSSARRTKPGTWPKRCGP